MPFQNVSKRRLAFAPRHVIVPEAQTDFTITLNEVDFAHTERISAPGKLIPLRGIARPDGFEKLPELLEIEAHISVADGLTVLASKLTRIDGDLHVANGARFYAPLLEEVTGFIYLGDRAVVNAPKIEHLFANDDHDKIAEQTGTNWLDSLAM